MQVEICYCINYFPIAMPHAAFRRRDLFGVYSCRGLGIDQRHGGEQLREVDLDPLAGGREGCGDGMGF